MPQHNFFLGNQWNVQCDQCGRVFKSSNIKLRWDGAQVCRNCWEPRHPQDFVKAVKDDPSVPFARPMKYDFYGDATPDSTVIGTHQLGKNTGGL